MDDWDSCIIENTILLEQIEGISTITLNRPKVLNSINGDLVDELSSTFARVKGDKSVRCVVITGNGKAFCAGGDLNYLSELREPVSLRRFIVEAGNLAYTIMNMGKPVIAMVNGAAAGAGFNLALACDFVVCAQSARFVQGFTHVGLVPDFGGTFLLPRLLGLQKAKELILTADPIDAETAYELGLVYRITDDSKLKEETFKLARKLADSASIAIGFAKKMLNESFDFSLASSLCRETEFQLMCMQTDDFQEGIAAFKDKRQPVFKGF